MIEESDNLQAIFEKQLEEKQNMQSILKEKLCKLNQKKYEYEVLIKNSQSEINKLESEINNLEQLKLGEKCNKCGSTISLINVNIFVSEKHKLIIDNESLVKELMDEIYELERNKSEPNKMS